MKMYKYKTKSDIRKHLFYFLNLLTVLLVFVHFSTNTVFTVCNMSDNCDTDDFTNASNPTNDPSTTIVQWNCRSLYQNLNHFKHFVEKHKPGILCLQSIGRTARELPFLEGYYYPPYYKLNKNNFVAVATYVSNDKKVSLAPSPTPSPEHLCITIKLATPGRALHITNVYYPEAVPRLNDTKWIADLQTNDKDWVIVGDFNAHHEDWGGAGTIMRGGGRHLSQHIVESDFVLLNDGSITRLPHRFGDNPSAIDLSLMTPGLRQQTNWEVSSDDLGSDHIPIIITISRNLENSNSSSENGFNFDKADWITFTQRLSTFDPIPSTLPIQEQYDIFCSRVMAVANETIPLKKHFENKISNPWWNDNCAAAVKAKSQAYSAYRKRTTDEMLEVYQRAKRHCKWVINCAKTEYWDAFVKEHVKEYTDTSKVWKKIRKMRRQYKVPDGPLKVNGVRVSSNLAKAEAFADTFASASQSRSLPQGVREFRQEQERFFTDPIPNNQSPINQEFSFAELQRCITSIKKTKKATGVDKISYVMFTSKHLPRRSLQALLGIYNCCWTQGSVPSQLKMAEVIPLLKNGKPRCDPASYRPISLTPHLGKI